jgi:vacuolar-type H+-ATPase subunit H
MASESLLESVARHEKELIAGLDSAREASREVVESAHAAGAALLQAAGEKLDAEIAGLRRNAAREREEVRQAIEKASADEVERIRSESAGRTQEVRKGLLSRILPGSV